MHNDPRDHAQYRNHHYRSHRDRDGYAYRAGSMGPGPEYFRLRRDLDNKMIAGVCAGLARYFGYPVEWVRLGWIVFGLFSAGMALLFYVAAAVIVRPARRYPGFTDDDELRVWKNAAVRPQISLSELKHRFRALDARISDMEYLVTSDEYGLRKAFRDLEKGH